MARGAHRGATFIGTAAGMSDIYASLSALIAEELGIPIPKLRPETELDQIPGWDSATFAGVLLGIETSFGVTATRQQISNVRYGADLAALCAKDAAVP
jgi:acyl carrier protein